MPPEPVIPTVRIIHPLASTQKLAVFLGHGGLLEQEPVGLEQRARLLEAHYIIAGAIFFLEVLERALFFAELGQHGLYGVIIAAPGAPPRLFFRDKDLVHLLAGPDARDLYVNGPGSDERLCD